MARLVLDHGCRHAGSRCGVSGNVLPNGVIGGSRDILRGGRTGQRHPARVRGGGRLGERTPFLVADLGLGRSAAEQAAPNSRPLVGAGHGSNPAPLAGFPDGVTGWPRVVVLARADGRRAPAIAGRDAFASGACRSAATSSGGAGEAAPPLRRNEHLMTSTSPQPSPVQAVGSAPHGPALPPNQVWRLQDEAEAACSADTRRRLESRHSDCRPSAGATPLARGRSVACRAARPCRPRSGQEQFMRFG